MDHANKIFRVAVDMIMNGSDFPSGRKGIISTAVGVKKNKGKGQGNGII